MRYKVELNKRYSLYKYNDNEVFDDFPEVSVRFPNISKDNRRLAKTIKITKSEYNQAKLFLWLLTYLIYLHLYNNPSYSRIFIGSRL